MTLRISWNTTTTALDDEGDLQARSYEHTLEFDAVTSEAHEGTSVLTEHAVESGAPLSDHKRPNPDRVSIEAIVSNTPLDAPPPSGYGDAGGVGTSYDKDKDSAAVVVFSRGFDRVQDVISTLERLRLEATSVTLSTRWHVYEDVQIVSVRVPREPTDGDSIRVQLDLQTVRVAQTRTVDAPQPREPRGARRRPRGGQEAEDAGQRTSALERARADYEARRARGESRTDALLGATGAAFGG